jgi:hypothetical protein
MNLDRTGRRIALLIGAAIVVALLAELARCAG